MSTDDPIIEEVEISGHIIDSLILPKVLDTITAGGGKYRITNIAIGQSRHDPSSAVIEVRAVTPERMHKILSLIADHGAVLTTKQDCRFEPADMDGAFPEAFYSRSVLQHDEPTLRSSHRRKLGRSRGSGDGLRNCAGRSEQ
jgi:hypothetical protein